MAQRPRLSLWRRLGSPNVILAFGLFDVALGAAYVVQPRVRGQGIFFLVAGTLLTVSSLALKRQARRRAEAASKPAARQWQSRSSPARAAPARGRAAKAVPARARGPKAGAKSRLAGPSRYKPEAAPEPRRLFRKKDESPRPDAPRKPGGRKGDVG